MKEHSWAMDYFWYYGPPVFFFFFWIGYKMGKSLDAYLPNIEEKDET